MDFQERTGLRKNGSGPNKSLGLVILGVLLIVALLAQSSRLSPHLLLAQESPLFTPTPTPLKRTVNEITEPLSSDAIFGVTNIVGTALIDAFQRYDVHISEAGMDNWQWLTTDFRVVHDGTLYQLNTFDYPDGYYDIRVRAIDRNGEFTESFVRGVEIRNWNPPTLTPAPGTPTPISPLPTPTPEILSRIPGGQGFYAPDNSAVLHDTVEIKATVNGKRNQRFKRFELDISPYGQEQWTWLHGEPRQVWQDTIYTLDTTKFPDGRYDLRLRNVYEDGNYDEFFLRGLVFANAGAPKVNFEIPVGISSPRSGSTVSGVVDIVGSVPASELLRWELSWSPSGRDNWSFLVGGNEPVNGETIARLDLGQLNPGQYDLRLRVVRSDYNYTDYMVRDLQVNPG